MFNACTNLVFCLTSLCKTVRIVRVLIVWKYIPKAAPLSPYARPKAWLTCIRTISCLSYLHLQIEIESISYATATTT